MALTLTTLKPILKANPAEVPGGNSLKIKTGLHTLPNPSFPEARPEAKASMLLLIKDYNSRKVRARRTRASRRGRNAGVRHD